MPESIEKFNADEQRHRAMLNLEELIDRNRIIKQESGEIGSIRKKTFLLNIINACRNNLFKNNLFNDDENHSRSLIGKDELRARDLLSLFKIETVESAERLGMQHESRMSFREIKRRRRRVKWKEAYKNRSESGHDTSNEENRNQPDTVKASSSAPHLEQSVHVPQPATQHVTEISTVSTHQQPVPLPTARVPWPGDQKALKPH
jgi:hypothetical protein